MDHKNRNSEQCNLPPDEIDALKQLIQLQKDRVITIKAADKGAGIVILNFSDYMEKCYEHLYIESVCFSDVSCLCTLLCRHQL